MTLADVLHDHDKVLDTATVLDYLTYDQVRWKLRSGRWQKPARGIIVAHSGELTDKQVLRVAVLWGGSRSVIGGLSAAWLAGFTGFGDRQPAGERPVFLLVPPGWNARPRVAGIRVVPRYPRTLRAGDVHPVQEPRRTRYQRLRRRQLIARALEDIAGGAQALSELDFSRKVVRRHRLPEPDRQMARRDRQGRQRWIDVAWDEWKILVEIDGAQHMSALEYWDDMDRGNEFTIEGYRLLRFPAWVVRLHPDLVAARIRDAFLRAGCRC